MQFDWSWLGKLVAPLISLLPGLFRRSKDKGTKATVLIVENDEQDAELIQWAVKRVGYPCEIVRDAETALLRVIAHRYAIVITDIMLPNQDGWWLVAAILDRIPETRIIVTTGSQQPKVSHLGPGRAVVLVVKDGVTAFVDALHMLKV